MRKGLNFSIQKPTKEFQEKEKMNSKQADELKVNYHTMSFFSKIISKFR